MAAHRPQPRKALAVHRVEAADGTTQFVLSGEFDVDAAEHVAGELAASERQGAVVVADLRGVTFMDSSGLQVLLVAQARMRAAGARFVVVNGPRAVRRVFEITDTAQRLNLVDRPEAVSELPAA